MILFPNAKINIGLFVVSKRADGYHNIETSFLPVKQLYDVLEVVDNDEPIDQFFTSGIPIPGESNLVLLGLKKMRERGDIPPLKIHLHKVIPIGSGLGGGSSDAAYMLRLLNEQYSVGLSTSELEDIAKAMGADCPFFIQNNPVLATGIGDVFQPISMPLHGYWLQIVTPSIHIHTAEAYQNIALKSAPMPLEECLKLPVESWRKTVYNDFEESVFCKYPELKQIKDRFYQKGAVYSSMSGSGSALYGIFKEKPDIVWDKKQIVHVEEILSL